MSSSDLHLTKLSSFGFFALLKIGGACEVAGHRGAAAGRQQAPHLGLLAPLEHLGAYQGITDTLTLNPSSSRGGPRTAVEEA